MSFAMLSPAPFENNENNENENAISKKKTHNRTQKMYPKQDIDSNKVNSVLQAIHNNSTISDGGSTLGDFNPPTPPTSIGSERATVRENMQNKNGYDLGKQPVPSGEDMELNNLRTSYSDEQSVEEYYKNFIPNYPPAAAKHTTTMYGTNDILIEKLNYMINLLEEKQDERTNNVTEEVVLYSFLGIFIIFIVDSFARVGKYTR